MTPQGDKIIIETGMLKTATAFAPASVGNTASGFDILGFCLAEPGDTVTARRTDEPSVIIEEISGMVEDLPLEAKKNTAGKAALSVLERARAEFGVVLRIQKGIALGSGMGGSAASAVAAAVAVNALLPKPLPQNVLYQAALDGEAMASGARHGDNVGPALIGGIVLTDKDAVYAMPIPDGVFAVVVHPPIVLHTREMRAAIPPTVPLQTVTSQTRNFGKLILGCLTNDDALISQGLHDVMIEPHRAPFIPKLDEVLSAARANGALGGSIAGAGPSIFAWVRGEAAANAVCRSMQLAFAMPNVDIYISPLNIPGARLVSHEIL